METRAKVLLIDDDADMLSTTQLLLGSRGYDVLTAASPEEGLRRLEKDRPDVVLLDVMMPEGTEGFHWVWNLRKHPDAGLRDVPIIILSSVHSTTPLRFHAGDADESGDYLPVQGFIDKPVDPDRLARKIESVLGNR